MTDLDRPKFIGVAALMRDIAYGVGSANRILGDESPSVAGVLAVKTATVDVQFEMTSAATSDDLGASADLPLLGAKTLSLSSATTREELINHTTIRLEIVSVVPPKEDSDAERAAKYRQALGLLKAQLDKRKDRDPKLHRTIAQKLARAERLIAAGDLDAAEKALLTLARVVKAEGSNG